MTFVKNFSQFWLWFQQC